MISDFGVVMGPQKGNASTVSAAPSIASCAGLPTTGTIDVTAPAARMGTVTSFVKTHPDSPQHSAVRSTRHLSRYTRDLLLVHSNR